MRYITEIRLTSRFFQANLAYQLEYHNNSGTLPLRAVARRYGVLRGVTRRTVAHSPHGRSATIISTATTHPTVKQK